MLILMNSDRALFGNAGADAVRPLDRFGPHATQPRPPVLELAGYGLMATMLDRYTIGIAQKNNISCLLHDLV